MTFFKKAFSLLRETAAAFGRNNASMLAASLAYYAIFAIAPLLVIAVAVAGFVFGDAAVQGQLDAQLEGTFGREAAVLIEDLVAGANQTNAGLFATVVSVILLLLAASGLFGQLKKALNTIWEAEPTSDQGILGFALQRIVAISMVLLIGLILLASMSASTAIVFLSDFVAGRLPVLGRLLPYLEVIVSLTILVLLFALIYRILPDVKLAWRDVFVGGAVTALLFAIGKYLISFYLSFNGNNPTYQAAGAVVIVLLWIYYSSQIFLFGAQFTCVYAERGGAPADTGKAMSPIDHSRPRLAASTPVVSPAQPRVVSESAVSQTDNRKITAAALLLGTALGLLLAFLGNLFGQRTDDPQ